MPKIIDVNFKENDKPKEPLWVCKVCAHELWDEKDNDAKPIGINAVIMNSQGQGAPLPLQVCPECNTVSMSEIVFKDLQEQMTSPIIQPGSGPLV